jgi:hypothetical protein
MVSLSSILIIGCEKHKPEISDMALSLIQWMKRKTHSVNVQAGVGLWVRETIGMEDDWAWLLSHEKGTARRLTG